MIEPANSTESNLGRIPMDPVASHRMMLADGFVKLNFGLSAAEVDLIRPEVDELLMRKSQSRDQFILFARSGKWHPTLLGSGGRNTKFFDFFGDSPHLDARLDNLRRRPELQELLLRVLGPGFRIEYVQIRRAEVGAAPLSRSPR